MSYREFIESIEKSWLRASIACRRCLVLNTSNIKSIQIKFSNLKKKYLIYKTWAQWCLQYHLGFFQNGAKMFLK